ncbi:MAG: hemerythrin domain-containing protein [Bdellovibrionaceae bacterium]|nr:hemerythrin domain-containing protein [Pseudobdellovibrionaceae bacterium]
MKQQENVAVKRNEAELDILNMILEDHKPLKQLIKILKNDEKDLNQRKAAFEEFAILLVSHAKPEEQTLYVAMKKKEDLRAEALEGDVEHGLADQLVEEIHRTENDDDLWSARTKVLAELVEHHIEEEEKQLLPDYRKKSTPNERIQLGQAFLKIKTELLEQGGVDSPNEASLQH